MPNNRAAWLNTKGARLHVQAAPYPSPRENEIVVKNYAAAINPLDWIKQAAGDFVFGWIKYPFILGSDLAGEVVEIGSGVTRFTIGDRVLAHAVGTDPARNSAAEGSFQTYTVVLENMTAPIPNDMPYENAAVLPLGLSTAAWGLFQKDQLALDYPSASATPKGKAVLVWGGSTSVGSNAIQLAVAAGYEVIATASTRNFEYLKKLGARHVFDYHDTSAVKNIINSLRGKTLAGALAIGAGSADACINVVSACTGNKFVSMATFPISFQNASADAGFFQRFAMIRTFVWASAMMWLKTKTRGIQTKYIFGSSLIKNEVSKIIYEDFLPQALADGRYIAAPGPHIAGTGLESIQAALDLQRRGVSASKVVITLS